MLEHLVFVQDCISKVKKLILYASTPQNAQIHSSNSSAVAKRRAFQYFILGGLYKTFLKLMKHFKVTLVFKIFEFTITHLIQFMVLEIQF